MQGIQTVVGKCRVRWKVIAFRHNEHQIEEIKELAKSLGVGEIRINKSARFREGVEDPLRPLSGEWIGLRSKNQSVVKKALQNGDRELLRKQVQVRPQCATAQEIFVSFEGKVYPCCSCAMYQTSEYARWFKRLEQRNDLRSRSFQKILRDPVWESLQILWDSPEAAPASCAKRCGVVASYSEELRPDEYMARPQSDNLKIRI
jgi:MoaA/NifB/PqqE/SkfB family radical SAM enzyme